MSHRNPRVFVSQYVACAEQPGAFRQLQPYPILIGDKVNVLRCTFCCSIWDKAEEKCHGRIMHHARLRMRLVQKLLDALLAGVRGDMGLTRDARRINYWPATW